MRAQAQIAQMLPLVRRVMAQTRARVLGGDKHYRDKVFSLFEPQTEAIRKGKASKPTGFGKLVKIQEAENQFVVDYQVYQRRRMTPNGSGWPRRLDGRNSQPIRSS